MATNVFGYKIRYTEAIEARHLFVQGGLLFLGTHGIWPNVWLAVAKGECRIISRLFELVKQSELTGRSVEWTP